MYVNCKCNGENCKLNIAKARQKQRLESAYLLTAVLLVFRLTFALFDRIFLYSDDSPGTVQGDRESILVEVCFFVVRNRTGSGMSFL